MKICWVYDKKSEYTGCRLFRSQKKAVETINDFMKNKGYTELTMALPNPDRHDVRVYINGDDIKSFWYFLWVDLEE